MPAKKGTKKTTKKKVEETVEKVVEAKEEENKATEVVEEPEKVVEIEEEKIETPAEDEDFNGENESLNIVERFIRFETETKVGIISSLILLFAVIFSWDWINTTWWLVLIIAAVSLKTLHTQFNDLEEDKPFESKMSRLFFIGTMILLVIRDLIITARLDDWMDFME